MIRQWNTSEKISTDESIQRICKQEKNGNLIMK